MIDEAIEEERTKKKKKKIVTVRMRSRSEAVRRKKNLRDSEAWPRDYVSLRVE